MKQIFLDNEPTPFYINETGALWRKDTNHWYSPFESGGYLSYHLKWKNKTYPRRIHRLVAEAFIPNPDNLPFVHHKDHNRFNNCVTNLAWSSIQENNQDKLKRKNQEKYINKKIEESKEEWKQYLDTDFWVSNMGQVKNKKTGNILKGNIRENGYIRYGLRYDGKIHSFNGHNLVWLVWKGKQKGVINHINGDKLDNRLQNLEDVSQSENLIKANIPSRTPVCNSLTPNGEIIKIFSSQGQAAKYYNINVGSVNKAIYNGWRAGGFYWRKVKEEDYV